MNTLIVFIISLLFAGENPETEHVSPEAVEVNQEQMTTYYFIRHAEKDESPPQNKDPELTEEGKARAAKWAEIFKEVDFDMIYSSDYNRTRSTATAIADKRNKQVELYDPRNLNSKEFQERTKGKTVLVVGHSNTNPAFVNSVLRVKKYGDIDEKESGSLFIVQIAPDGTESSQVLYIN